MPPATPSVAKPSSLRGGERSFRFQSIQCMHDSLEHSFLVARHTVCVETVVDHAGVEPDKRVSPCEAKIKRIVLDNPNGLVEESGLDKGLSTNHGCPGTSNRVAFKEHE